MKNNQSGRSMIEMLGVLAIIGVLSVGGIAGYSKAMAKYRSNKVIEQISMLVTNTRTMYAQQQTYVNLDNWMAIEMGLVPDDLIVISSTTDGSGPDGNLRNVFGGPVQIAASSADGAPAEGVTTRTYDAFIVSFYGLSRDACVAIATSDWGAGSSSGLLGMHVFDTAVVTSIDPATVTSNIGTSSEAETIEDSAVTVVDTVIDSLAKTATITETPKGNVSAVPGDAKVSIPLRVDQARLACSCTSKSTCAVSWKYY